MSPGTLYLVPAPLDFGCEADGEQPPLTDVLPERTLVVAAGLRHWVCENAKTTRAYLKRIAVTHPLACELQQMAIRELPREAHKKGDHVGTAGAGGQAAAQAAARALLAPLLTGQDVGLVSEAGMPAIADPGSSLVRAAHEMGAPVVPLVGPVSLMLALAASGLNGQNFAFVGYLPQDAAQRATRIRELETLALRTGQSQLFIETPYRNAALLAALLQNLEPNTRLALCAGLTLPQATIRSRSVKAWKQDAQPAGKDTPCVYAIGR